MNPVGSQRPGSPVSVACAGQCARATPRWRGQSGPGADGRRPYRGTWGEEDELPTRKLVISRAHRDTDEEMPYFLAPERIPSKRPVRGLGSFAQAKRAARGRRTSHCDLVNEESGHAPGLLGVSQASLRMHPRPCQCPRSPTRCRPRPLPLELVSRPWALVRAPAARAIGGHRAIWLDPSPTAVSTHRLPSQQSPPRPAALSLCPLGRSPPLLPPGSDPRHTYWTSDIFIWSIVCFSWQNVGLPRPGVFVTLIPRTVLALRRCSVNCHQENKKSSHPLRASMGLLLLSATCVRYFMMTPFYKQGN